jgi:hypothetical protein
MQVDKALIGAPSIADRLANRLIARLFRTRFPKISRWNIGTRESGGTAAGMRRDSNLPSQVICTVYDSRIDPRPKPALSRTAQRVVFAVWVLGCGAIGHQDERPPR